MLDEKKKLRQQALEELISSQTLKTQSDLVDALRNKGFKVGQATVSRDIQELGVARSGGIYSLPNATQNSKGWVRLLQHPQLKISPAGDALVIVRIGLGQAPFLAAELDKEEWPEVIGTVAGDDTLFIAVHSSKEQNVLIERLRKAI